MKKLSILLTVALVFVLASCGSTKGDTEIENKIAGTWTAEYSETEDGVLGYITETVNYDAGGHTFTVNVKCNLSYMEYSLGSFTMHANGTWSATKDAIVEKYEVDNIRLEFSRDYLENTETSEAEARREMMGELKSDLKEAQALKLNIISDSEIEQTDSEGTTVTYYRQ